MARKTADGYTGSVGKMVFYTMNGEQYLRTKPGKRKKKRGQVINPKQTAFGAVSKYGSAMAKQLNSHLLFALGRNGYNQLRGWMWNQYTAFAMEPDWEPGAKGNIICGLNAEADLRDFFAAAVRITDNGGGLIDINIPSINPEKEITAPAHTTKVKMKLVLASSGFSNLTGITDNVWMEQYDFDYTDTLLPAKTISINTSSHFASISGHIAIIALALEFETAETGRHIYNTEKRWLPAALIAMGRLK